MAVVSKKELADALRRATELLEEVAELPSVSGKVRERLADAASENRELVRRTPHRFDVREDRLYAPGDPPERTLRRLTEMADCGMEELGTAQFGYAGVMSGLWIEMVWNYDDERFDDYMGWAKSLINP